MMRVRGGTSVREPDATRQREVGAAFLAASRDGNFAGLVELLDPELRLRADTTAVRTAAANRAAGAPVLAGEIRGAHAVAESFSGRARAAQLVLVEGAVGAAWAPGGTASRRLRILRTGREDRRDRSDHGS
jgi:RNA polymerase sigma-70 factor, ECF subfamily